LIFLLTIPFLQRIIKIIYRLVPDQTLSATSGVRHIDNRVLNTPQIALGLARSEVVHMSQAVLKMISDSGRLFHRHSIHLLSSLRHQEQSLNQLQRELSHFLVALSQRSVASNVALEISMLMNRINDLKRICDHCSKLLDLQQRKISDKIDFSRPAIAEVEQLSSVVTSFMTLVVAALESFDDSLLNQARIFEAKIAQLEEKSRINHMSRLNTGECSVVSGLVYIDMLHHFGQIGEHAFNIAQSLAGER